MKLEGEDGIFMQIVRRKVPAEIVYEDEETLAFLDNAPTTLGHTLVIPKTPARNVFDVDEKAWQAVMRTVRKIVPVIRDAVGAKGVHINSNHEPAAGQVVFHLHVHIIPRHDRSEFTFWPPQEFDVTETKIVAEKIRNSIF